MSTPPPAPHLFQEQEGVVLGHVGNALKLGVLHPLVSNQAVLGAAEVELTAAGARGEG